MARINAAPGALFGVTVKFTVLVGRLPAFLDLVHRNAADSVKSESDCLRFDVLLPTDEPVDSRVLLYELYRDRDAFDRHLLSDHFLSFDAESRSLVLDKTIATYLVHENAK